jgi:hypothetical protein
MPSAHHRRDAGQATLLALGLVAVLAVLAVAVASAGRQLTDAQRASTAADAAALAGTTGGRPAAARHAAANGATLVSFDRAGFMVTVTVRVGDAVITARATNGP